MLIQIKIENFALIEIIEINFEKGLNILTGDSGSGKSLIFDSLNVLFGGTNIPLNHLIRPQKDECIIEAKFIPSNQVKNWLFKKDFHEINRELIIKRKSYKKNKKIFSKYYLNNLSINKKLLEELGPLLIDFAGQSDTFLFDSAQHRRSIVDDLGPKELQVLNANVKKIWNQYENLQFSLNEKIALFKEKEENNTAIEEMFKILDKANLNSIDEITKLESQEIILANNYDIKNSVKFLLNQLSDHNPETPSVDFLISQSIKNISKIAEFDTKIQKFSEHLLKIQNDVQSLIFLLNEYMQNFERSELSLEDIQKRLFFLKNIERTFSLKLPQLIQKRDEYENYLSNNSDEKEIEILELQIKKLLINLNVQYKLQSSERKKTADKLQNSVMGILNNLGLENANFVIDFEEVKASEQGIENIKFLFSANPDQKLAPISKVVSGGEMSRFLLAIKSCISKKPCTFFLDEIDNGLSGKSLFSLVELIKKISQDKQVLCITHQPFLAAAGNVHFKVKKNVIDGSTFTSISKLTTKKERQKELIELIGGGFSEANDYASTLLDRAAA